MVDYICSSGGEVTIRFGHFNLVIRSGFDDVSIFYDPDDLHYYVMYSTDELELTFDLDRDEAEFLALNLKKEINK